MSPLRLLALFSAASLACAQVPVPGITWERTTTPQKIHLCNEVGKHMMYEWSAAADLHTSAGHCASYRYDAATETESGRVTLVGPGTALILAFHEGTERFRPTNCIRELRVAPAS